MDNYLPPKSLPCIREVFAKDCPWPVQKRLDFLVRGIDRSLPKGIRKNINIQRRLELSRGVHRHLQSRELRGMG